MTDETQTDAPVISDPGGVGWPAEPRVTQAEISLYGDHAAIVRLLGQAAVDSGNAYALASKRVVDMYPNEENEAVYRDIVTESWGLHRSAVEVHREVADRALAQRRRVQEKVDRQDRGEALTSGLG